MIRVIVVIILNGIWGVYLFMDNSVIHEEDVQYYTGTVVRGYSESRKLPQSVATSWFIVMDNGAIFRTHYSVLKIHPENFVDKTVTIGYRSDSGSAESIPLITFSEGGVEYVSLKESQRDVYIVNIILIFVSVLLWSIYISYRYSRIKEERRILKERREIEKKRQLRQQKREEAQNASLTVQNPPKTEG